MKYYINKVLNIALKFVRLTVSSQKELVRESRLFSKRFEECFLYLGKTNLDFKILFKMIEIINFIELFALFKILDSYIIL